MSIVLIVVMLSIKKMVLMIPGSYSLSCVLPIIVGTVPYRRNQATSAIQMMPSSFNHHHRHDAPPPYSDLARHHMTDDDEPTRVTAASGSGGDDDHDDRFVPTTYTPLYTYVSDYIPPPPYSTVCLL